MLTCCENSNTAAGNANARIGEVTRGRWPPLSAARRATGLRRWSRRRGTRAKRASARARLYGATVTFADKKRLAETLVSGLGGADGASRAGAGGGHSATPGPATAAVLSEWALATLAWAGLAADISARGPRGGGSAGSGARGGIGGGGASKKAAFEAFGRRREPSGATPPTPRRFARTRACGASWWSRWTRRTNHPPRRRRRLRPRTGRTPRQQRMRCAPPPPPPRLSASAKSSWKNSSRSPRRVCLGSNAGSE